MESRNRIINHIFEKDVQQFQLMDEKLRWCQALVDADLKISGRITEETLQILEVQNAEVIDGKVSEKVNEKAVEYVKYFTAGEENKQAEEFQKETGWNKVLLTAPQYVEWDKWVVFREINDLPTEIQLEAKRLIELEEKYGILQNLENFTKEHGDRIAALQSETKNTLVVNAYAGPGAGKTTASLATVAELKKMGYVAEYVSEYAKELVYENPAMLDGSMQNQFALLTEQLRRMDRLIGKVDIIVTDSPILLNLIYGKDLPDEYKKMVPDLYKQYDNFNFFVKRGDAFEQNGRMQDLTESIQKDEEIRKLLDEQGLYYGTYTHETSEKLAQKIQVTYNRLYGEKDKEQKQVPKQNNTKRQEKAPYQGIAYPKKEGKDKPEAFVVFGKSEQDVISQIRVKNLSYPETGKMSSCYIRKLNPENEKYEDPQKYDLETGKNITTIYLKLPNLKYADFVKLTKELKEKGAKYNPIKKALYITKQDDPTPFKDYLPKDIEGSEKGQNEASKDISETQIIEKGEGAGLSTSDLQAIVSIGVKRGLQNKDIMSSLDIAIVNGKSKDQIYDLLTQDMNHKISSLASAETKKGSVLEALHENRQKISTDTETRESVHKDQEIENVK